MLGGGHKEQQMCDFAEAFSIPSFGPRPATSCGVFCFQSLTLYFVFLFVVPDCGSSLSITNIEGSCNTM